MLSPNRLSPQIGMGQLAELLDIAVFLKGPSLLPLVTLATAIGAYCSQEIETQQQHNLGTWRNWSKDPNCAISFRALPTWLISAPFGLGGPNRRIRNRSRDLCTP